MPRRLDLQLICFAALAVAPGIARAQATEGNNGAPSPTSAALADERQKLLTQLGRANAEIDALKRENRGLRDDYRLRARMADAEALARRLTELDGRLSKQPPGGTTPATPWPAAPQMRPFDDRGDLEAKADILSDQARRLGVQADLLAARVADVRGRHELRRRAGHLERDPFSPLEQTKRRIATSGGLAAGDRNSFAGPANGPRTGNESVPPRNDLVGVSGVGQPPPVTGAGSGAPGATPTTTGVGPAVSGATDQAARTGSTTTGSVPAPFASPLSGAAGPVVDGPGSVASQFRGILDANTLAEIRRLEVPGSPGGNLQAMERALSALRARAAELAGNAGALRKRAKTER